MAYNESKSSVKGGGKDVPYAPTPPCKTIYTGKTTANDGKNTQFPKGTQMKPPVPPQNRPY